MTIFSVVSAIFVLFFGRFVSGLTEITNTNPSSDNPFSISEAEAAGYVIATITATTDAYLVGAGSISIAWAVTTTTAIATHTFIGVSGFDLVLTSTFDYDTLTVTTFQGEITPTANPDDAAADAETGTPLSITIELTDVNDSPPSFDQKSYAVTISETAALNSPHTVTPIPQITDPDNTGGDTLTFTVTSTGLPFTTMDGVQVIVTSALDFETTSSYTMLLAPSDGTNTGNTVSFAITIQDENESPVCNSSLDFTYSIPETTATSTTVFTGSTMSCTDPDNDDSLTYNIVSASNLGESVFSMLDPATGDITLAQALDYASLPASDKTYVLYVSAEDTSSLGSTASVTISITSAASTTVTTVSSSAVTFTCTPQSYRLYIREDTAIGTRVMAMAGLNCDVDNLSYTLTQYPANSFILVTNSPTYLVLNTVLTKFVFYSLTIQVSDGSTTTNFAITVRVRTPICTGNWGMKHSTSGFLLSIMLLVSMLLSRVVF